jgi:hypothetical protein
MDPDDQAAYDEVYTELLNDYSELGATGKLMIERIATAKVRLRRIRRAEDALFQRARLVRESHEHQPHPNSISSMLPEGEKSRAFAVAIASASALPDSASLDSLSRYDTTFDRQLYKWLGALEVMKQNALESTPKAPAGAGRSSSPAQLRSVPSKVVNE